MCLGMGTGSVVESLSYKRTTNKCSTFTRKFGLSMANFGRVSAKVI